jgi:hypothetical protein
VSYNRNPLFGFELSVVLRERSAPSVMPRGRRPGIDASLLEAALIGFEHMKREVDGKIADIRKRLGVGVRAVKAAAGGAAVTIKRTMSAGARRRIAAAQRKRWAAVKTKAKQATTPATPKRTMSAAARKKIAAAQRKRWAELKKAGKPGKSAKAAA